MKWLLVLLSTVSVLASAQPTADLNAAVSLDGKIRQGNGVGRATPELAAMDLVSLCLGMPLVGAGLASFEGLEDLKFTPLPDGKTFAYAKCVYQPR